MKKYRVLKDFWGLLDVGEILSTENDTISIKTTRYSVTIKPSKMPEYFEEIKEQSLAEKMLSSGELTFLTGHDKERAKKLSNLAISEVLKVFDGAYKEYKNKRYRTGKVSFIRKAIENMKSEQNY